MFEVDTWETSGNGEDKLLRGLFGDHSKRKHKRQQTFNDEKEKQKCMNPLSKTADASMKATLMETHIQEKVKKVNTSLLKDGTAHSSKQLESSMSKIKRRRKRNKEQGELARKGALDQDSKTNLSERKLEKKKKKRTQNGNDSNRATGASNECLEGEKEITKIEDSIIKETLQQNSITNINERQIGKKKKKTAYNDYDNTNPGMHLNTDYCIIKDSIMESSVPSGQTSTYGAAKNLSTNKSRKSVLQEKLKQKLESSRFRWINEQLYTVPGEKALKMFQDDQSLFDVYHDGFRRQVERWPVNPVDYIIDWLNQRSSSLVLADFGCGEAIIAQSVPNKVFSFDLVAKNKLVTACNMAKVPLQAACIDVAIYCLSLMGTDLEAFLREAYRVLRPGGILKIAEVVSRMDVSTFIPAVCQLGFKLDNMDDSNKMFILLDFVKDHQTKRTKKKTNVSNLQLQPCIYKRR